MDKKSITFGLGPKKLADLLRVGSDSEQPEGQVTEEQKRSELLRDRIGEALPPDSFVPGTLPIGPNSLCYALGVLGGEPIVELLQNPESDIVLIECIKNYNSKLSQCARPKAEHDVAIAIYYGAIASALIFHKKKITKFSFKDLEDSFAILSEKKWMTDQLKKLFSQARSICQERKGSNDGEQKE